MGRWNILRSATDRVVAALWQQTKRARPAKRVRFVESLETRTLLNGTLIKDINTGPGSTSPTNLTNVGGTYFFTHVDEDGRELWKSDGTENGTVKIKDINPGAVSSDPMRLTAVGDTLYFVATTTLGRELWKSDGTSTGTLMVKDIYSGSADSEPDKFIAVGNALYFVANTSSYGNELWKSDGTETGTVLVKDIYSGTSSSNISNATIVNSTLFFTANSSSGGTELWKSDGTQTGTVQIKDIYSGSSSSYPSNLTVMGDTLYFAANNGSQGNELWKSNGTTSGTELVQDIWSGSSGSNPGNIIASGSTLYFSAETTAAGTELWKSNGTSTGTELVRDIYVGSNGSWPGNLTMVGSNLYFNASTSAAGGELWTSDGTYSGTVQVKDIWSGSSGSSPGNFKASGSTLYFTAQNNSDGTELWKSDGSDSGTVQVKNIQSGSGGSWPNHLTVVGGTLYFDAMTSSSGHELWKSDGTESGTVIIKDIYSGSENSTPYDLQANGSTLYFFAKHSSTGVELWKSDGTETGTLLVKDVNTFTDQSNPSQFTVIGTTVYFIAQTASEGQELWKSDGTATGTSLVKDIYPGSASAYPTNLTAVGGTLYFSAFSSSEGQELWKSDGTETGTVIVKDIVSGSSGSNPNTLTAVGSTLYFTATTSSAGTELWKSNGTSTGTELVKDIYTGSNSSSLNSLTAVNSTLYFVANNSTNGNELWKSDGTSTGTVLVKDIYSGTTGSSPERLTEMGNTLYFAATTSSNGTELWKSNGTSTGTVLVKDIVSGTSGSSPWYLTAIGSTLYFKATTSSHGNELWKSNGTDSGTVLVKDIYSGSSSSSPDYLIGNNNTLYFFAQTSAEGKELWKSDGTSGGTVLVEDMTAGSSSTSPSFVTFLDGILYFSVIDSGSSVWRSDGLSGGTWRLHDEAGYDSVKSIVGLSGSGSIMFSADDGTHGFEPWIISPPTAVAGTYDVDQDVLTELSGSGSSDPDPEATLTYKWDLDGDFIFGETGGSATRGNEVGMSPSFSSIGLSGGSTYNVWLRVTNSSGLSHTSYTLIDVHSTTPTGLVATATGFHSIELEWTDNALTEDEYQIQRSLTSDFSSYSSAYVAAGATGHTATGLSAGTLYYFRVRAIFPDLSYSAWSNVDSDQTVVEPEVTNAYVNLNTLPHKIIFEFSKDVSATLSASDLYTYLWGSDDSRLSPSDFSLSYNSGSNTATFSYTENDGQLPEGFYTATIFSDDVTDNASNELIDNGYVDFKFMVGDADDDGASDGDDADVIDSHYGMTSGATRALGDLDYDGDVDDDDYDVISNSFLPGQASHVETLTVWEITGGHRKLAWVDLLNGASEFRIQRTTDGKTFTTIATTSAGAITYTDTTASLGTDYVYRVRAVDSNSSYSISIYSSLRDETATRPTTPGSMSASSAEQNAVHLSWTASTGVTLTGYEVWAKRGSSGAYTKLTNLDSSSTSYNATGLKAESDYTFRVRAVAAASVSEFAEVEESTLAGPPRILRSYIDVNVLPNRMIVEFDQPIYGPFSAGSVSLTNLSTGAVATGVSVDFDGGDEEIVITATVATHPNLNISGVWNDGHYEAVIDTAAVYNSHSQQPTADLVAPGFRLLGDFDQDRDVDSQDQSALMYNYGKSGVAHGAGNLNYSNNSNTGNATFGVVDEDDLDLLGEIFGAVLVDVPNSPGELVAQNAPGGGDVYHEIALTWAAATGTFTGTDVFRSVNGIDFELAGSVSNSATSFLDEDLQDGKKYVYRIRTYTMSGSQKIYSFTSNTATATTLIPNPTEFNFDQVSDSSVVLTWVDPGSSTHRYRIYVYENGLENDPIVNSVVTATPDEDGVVSVPIEGLTAGQEYLYTVSSITRDGESAATPPASVRVGLVEVTLPEEIFEEDEFELTLSVGENPEPIQWYIDWGDGSDPDEDDWVGEVVSGEETSVTHEYDEGEDIYEIQVKGLFSEEDPYSISFTRLYERLQAVEVSKSKVKSLEAQLFRTVESVRNNIKVQAYDYQVKGPTGTLQSGAGNSLDQAALLVHLIEKTSSKIKTAFSATIKELVIEAKIDAVANWLGVKDGAAAKTILKYAGLFEDMDAEDFFIQHYVVKLAPTNDAAEDLFGSDDYIYIDPSWKFQNVNSLIDNDSFIPFDSASYYGSVLASNSETNNVMVSPLEYYKRTLSDALRSQGLSLTDIRAGGHIIAKQATRLSDLDARGSAWQIHDSSLPIYTLDEEYMGVIDPADDSTELQAKINISIEIQNPGALEVDDRINEYSTEFSMPTAGRRLFSVGLEYDEFDKARPVLKTLDIDESSPGSVFVESTYDSTTTDNPFVTIAPTVKTKITVSSPKPDDLTHLRFADQVYLRRFEEVVGLGIYQNQFSDADIQRMRESATELSLSFGATVGKDELIEYQRSVAAAADIRYLHNVWRDHEEIAALTRTVPLVLPMVGTMNAEPATDDINFDWSLLEPLRVPSIHTDNKMAGSVLFPIEGKGNLTLNDESAPEEHRHLIDENTLSIMQTSFLESTIIESISGRLALSTVKGFAAAMRQQSIDSDTEHDGFTNIAGAELELTVNSIAVSSVIVFPDTLETEEWIDTLTLDTSTEPTSNVERVEIDYSGSTFELPFDSVTNAKLVGKDSTAHTISLYFSLPAEIHEFDSSASGISGTDLHVKVIFKPSAGLGNLDKYAVGASTPQVRVFMSGANYGLLKDADAVIVRANEEDDEEFYNIDGETIGGTNSNETSIWLEPESGTIAGFPRDTLSVKLITAISPDLQRYIPSGLKNAGEFIDDHGSAFDAWSQVVDGGKNKIGGILREFIQAGSVLRVPNKPFFEFDKSGKVITPAEGEPVPKYLYSFTTSSVKPVTVEGELDYDLAFGMIIIGADGATYGGSPQGTPFVTPEVAKWIKGAGTSFVGDPVNTVSGNLIYDETDVSLPGVGLGLNFSRHYDSFKANLHDERGEKPGMMGYGWSHTYSDYLTFESNNGAPSFDLDADVISWHRPDGSVVRMEYNDDYYDLHESYLLPDGTFGQFFLDGDVEHDLNGELYRYHFKGTDGVEYTFDRWKHDDDEQMESRGRLVEVKDRNGNSIHIEWDPSLDLTSETPRRISYVWSGTNQSAPDADGNRWLHFVYESEGHNYLKSIEDSAGRFWNYQYRNVDAPGTATSDYMLWKVLGPLSSGYGGAQNMEYTYYDDSTKRYGYLKEIKNHNMGAVTSYKYYGNGRVFSTTDPARKTEYFAYDLLNGTTTHVDTRDNVTRFTFDQDALYHLKQTELPDGSVSWQEWANIHDVDGSDYNWDLTGPDFGSSDGEDTDEDNDDANDGDDGRYLLLSEIDASNRKTSYGYTEQTAQYGRPKIQILPPLDYSDSENRDELTVRYCYDQLSSGYVAIERIETSDGQIEKQDDRIEEFGIDQANGNVIWTKNANGDYTTSVYNARGQLLRTTSSRGLVDEAGTYDTDVEDNPITPEENRGYTTFFDYESGSGLLLEMKAGGPSAVDQSISTWEYNAYGHLIKQTDPTGRVTTFITDLYGNVRETTVPDPDGPGPLSDATTKVTYRDGAAIQTIDGNGKITKIDRDNQHRIRSTHSTSAPGSVSYEYDALGNVVATKDELGRRTLFIYDELNRKVQTVNPDGSTTLIRYRADGSIAQSATTTRTTSFYGLDYLARTTYSYYDDGKVKAVTNAERETEEFVYWPFGEINEYRLYNKDEYANAEPQAWSRTITQVDDLGRPIDTRSSDSAPVTIHYDQNGNIDVVTTYDTTDYVESGVHIFTGSLSAIDEDDLRITTTQYDVLDRPFSVTDAAGNITKTAYDKSGRVVTTTDARGSLETEVPEDFTFTNDYDGAGRSIYAIGPDLKGDYFARRPVESTRYDLVGNAIGSRNADGWSSETVYDGRNRPIQHIDARADREKYILEYGSGAVTSGVDDEITDTSRWALLGSGDFNGDAYTDLIVLETTDSAHRVHVQTRASGEHIASVESFHNSFLDDLPSDGKFVGTGDFNDDGYDDIVWETASDEIEVWLINGSGDEIALEDSETVETVANTHVLGVAALGSSHIATVLLRKNDSGGNLHCLQRESNGDWSNGTLKDHEDNPLSRTLDWEFLGSGDFNGDTYNDLAWRDKDDPINSQALGIWYFNGYGKRTVADNSYATVNGNYQVIGVGNFDTYLGTQTADILVRYRSDLDSADLSRGKVQSWNIEDSDEYFTNITQSADSNWTAVTGNFDTGPATRSEILWVNPITGQRRVQYRNPEFTSNQTTIDRATSKTDYNAASEVYRTTDTRGNSTAYEYDALSRLTKTTLPDPDGTESGADLTRPITTSAYNAAGLVTSQTDVLGITTYFNYDDLGRLIDTWILQGAASASNPDSDARTNLSQAGIGGYFSVGDRVELRDEQGAVLGRAFVYSIDESGDSLELNEILAAAQTLGDVNVVLTSSQVEEFAAGGQVSRSLDGRGVEWEFDHDGAGRLTNTYVPDQGTGWVGRTTLSTTVFSHLGYATDDISYISPDDDDEKITTSYTHDKLGRVVTVTRPDVGGSEEPSTTRSVYDAVGNLVYSIDELGVVNLTVEESSNPTDEEILTWLDDPENEVFYSQTQYDALNRAIRIIGKDPATDFGPTIVEYKRDFSGHVVTQFGPTQIEDSESFDNVVNFIYDSLGRVTAESTSGVYLNTSQTNSIAPRTWTYDDVANEVTYRNRNEQDIISTYDNLGRLVIEDTIESDGYTTKYRSDTKIESIVGPGASTTYPDGFFDSLGRPTRVEKTVRVGDDTTTTLDLKYSPLGDIVRFNIIPNEEEDSQASYSRSFDEFGRQRAAQFNESDFSDVAKRVEFNYNLIDQYTSIDRRYAPSSSWVTIGNTQFDYDPAARLKSIDHYKDTGTSNSLASFEYAHDIMDRIVTFTINGVDRDYVYDANDRLTQDSTVAAYIYDENGNRQSAGTSTGRDNRLAEDADWIYEYDLEGNIIVKASKEQVSSHARWKWTYTYDYRNRMTEALLGERVSSSYANRKKMSYAYDENNQRVQERVEDYVASSDVTERYVYDGNEMIAVTNDEGELNTLYLHGPGADDPQLEDRGDSEATWYLSDHQGSVRKTQTINGTQDETYDYDAFGNLAQLPEQPADTGEQTHDVYENGDDRKRDSNWQVSQSLTSGWVDAYEGTSPNGSFEHSIGFNYDLDSDSTTSTNYIYYFATEVEVDGHSSSDLTGMLRVDNAVNRIGVIQEGETSVTWLAETPETHIDFDLELDPQPFTIPAEALSDGTNTVVFETWDRVINPANYSGTDHLGVKFWLKVTWDDVSDPEPSRFMYTGQEWDAETELYYYGNRYMDPKTGRFTSEDPAKDGFNLGEYVASNPVNMMDPTGLAAVTYKQGAMNGGSPIGPSISLDNFSSAINQHVQKFGSAMTFPSMSSSMSDDVNAHIETMANYARSANQLGQLNNGISQEWDAVDYLIGFGRNVANSWVTLPLRYTTGISTTQGFDYLGMARGKNYDYKTDNWRVNDPSLVDIAPVIGPAREGVHRWNWAMSDFRDGDIVSGSLELGSSAANFAQAGVDLTGIAALIRSAPRMVTKLPTLAKSAKGLYSNALNFLNDGPRATRLASPELINSVQEHGRTINWAVEGSDELRFLEWSRANASAGGEGATNLILKPDVRHIEILEEFLHGTQSKIPKLQRLQSTAGNDALEIHVRRFMLRHERMLGINGEERQMVRDGLAAYIKKGRNAGD